MQRWIYTIVLSGLLTATAFAQANDEGPAIDDNWRIIDGVEAVGDSWPWQVALYRRQVNRATGELSDRSFVPICGGSVVSARWILTAAHCFNKSTVRLNSGIEKEFSFGPRDYFVLEGTKRLSDNSGRQLAAKRIIAHKDFKVRGPWDIALIELAAAAQSTPAPLAHAPAAALESPGRTAIVTGFGQIRSIIEKRDPITHDIIMDSNGDPVFIFADTKEEVTKENVHLADAPGGKLRQVEVPLVSSEDCRSAYKFDWLDRHQICAGFPVGGKDSCQGDSGGPLVVRDDKGTGGWIQVGVVSEGRGCALPGFPGIYTRVSEFADWLKQNTGIDQDLPSTETQQVVENIFEQKNPAGLTVGFVQGSRLKLGQSVQLRVTAREAGYLVLLDIQSDGSVVQIYPNQASMRTPTGRRPDANRITPDRTFVIPNPANVYEGFRLVVRPPLGEGKIVAVLADKPLKWLKASNQPRVFSARADALGFLAEFAAASSRDQAQPERDRPRVSNLITSYTVVE